MPPGSRGEAARPGSAGVPGAPPAPRGRSGVAPLPELPRGAPGGRAAGPPSACPSRRERPLRIRARPRGSRTPRISPPPAGSGPQRYPRVPPSPPGPAPLTGRDSPVPQVQNGSAARPASGSDLAKSGATCAGAESPRLRRKDYSCRHAPRQAPRSPGARHGGARPGREGRGREGPGCPR